MRLIRRVSARRANEYFPSHSGASCGTSRCAEARATGPDEVSLVKSIIVSASAKLKYIGEAEAKLMLALEIGPDTGNMHLENMLKTAEKAKAWIRRLSPDEPAPCKCRRGHD